MSVNGACGSWASGGKPCAGTHLALEPMVQLDLHRIAAVLVACGANRKFSCCLVLNADDSVSAIVEVSDNREKHVLSSALLHAKARTGVARPVPTGRSIVVDGIPASFSTRLLNRLVNRPAITGCRVEVFALAA